MLRPSLATTSASCNPRLTDQSEEVQAHQSQGTCFVSDATAKKEERRKFQAIKGTRDILPPETELWTRAEQAAREVFSTFGYGEIRPPIIEDYYLFARAVGEDSDIVAKELVVSWDAPVDRWDALRVSLLKEFEYRDYWNDLAHHLADLVVTGEKSTHVFEFKNTKEAAFRDRYIN